MVKFKTIFEKIFRLIYPHKNPIFVKQNYGLPESLDLNIRVTEDGWFVVTSPNLPGFVTQAKDQQELIEMVNDAILTYFDVPRKEADIVYDYLQFGDQRIQYKAQLRTKPA